MRHRLTTGPGVNAASVAEGALMSMLMIARRVRHLGVRPVQHCTPATARLKLRACRAAQLHGALQVGEQQETFRQRGIGFPMGTQLAGKTLGIIGMGNIGVVRRPSLRRTAARERRAAMRMPQTRLRGTRRRVTIVACCCCCGHASMADLSWHWAAGRRLARAAEALDMTVVGTSSRSSRDELEALLSAADVISVHCPLTPATQDLIGCECEIDSLQKPHCITVTDTAAAVIPAKWCLVETLVCCEQVQGASTLQAGRALGQLCSRRMLAEAGKYLPL